MRGHASTNWIYYHFLPRQYYTSPFMIICKQPDKTGRQTSSLCFLDWIMYIFSCQCSPHTSNIPSAAAEGIWLWMSWRRRPFRVYYVRGVEWSEGVLLLLRMSCHKIAQYITTILLEHSFPFSHVAIPSNLMSDDEKEMSFPFNVTTSLVYALCVRDEWGIHTAISW